MNTKNSDVLNKAVIRSVLLALHKKIRHVVQVGACDGIAFDFYNALWQVFRWNTTFVEPHPVLFAKLQETYKDADSCEFLQGAIDVSEGIRSLFCDLENHYGNSSFYNEVCQGGTEIQVSTFTWDYVLEEDTDLVILDCEGHDEVLLRDLFKYATPKLLIWEATRVKDLNALLTFLRDKGYGSIKGDTSGLNYISILQLHKE